MLFQKFGEFLFITFNLGIDFGFVVIVVCKGGEYIRMSDALK